MFSLVISTIFGFVANLLISINVPGFNFSFWSLYMAIFVINIAMFILKTLLGIGNSGVVFEKWQSGYYSRSNTKPKISENRKGDTK